MQNLAQSRKLLAFKDSSPEQRVGLQAVYSGVDFVLSLLP